MSVNYLFKAINFFSNKSQIFSLLCRAVGKEKPLTHEEALEAVIESHTSQNIQKRKAKKCRNVPQGAISNIKLEYSTVQYSKLEYSTVQYSKLEYSTVQYIN